MGLGNALRATFGEKSVEKKEIRANCANVLGRGLNLFSVPTDTIFGAFVDLTYYKITIKNW